MHHPEVESSVVITKLSRVMSVSFVFREVLFYLGVCTHGHNVLFFARELQ